MAVHLVLLACAGHFALLGVKVRLVRQIGELQAAQELRANGNCWQNFRLSQ